MSRKTSSIVNRLNITYFWNFKKYSFQTSILKSINNFKLISSFLFLRKMYLIYYYVNNIFNNKSKITLLVYFFDLISKSIKYNKKFNLLIQFKLIYFTNYFNFFFSNFIKLTCYLKSLIQKFKNFNLLLASLYLYIYCYKFIKIFYLRNFLFNTINVRFYWLKKRHEYLKFKHNSILVKNIEYDLKLYLSKFYSKSSINITIISIFKILKAFNFKLYLNFFQFYKYTRLSYFWNFVNIFYLGILFNRIDLILGVIAKEISRKKTIHKRYLYSIIKILAQIYRQKILPIKGLRLTITGKVDSKERKKKISFSKGSLKLQTFNTKLLYNLIHYDTKFGVISLRFWLVKF